MDGRFRATSPIPNCGPKGTIARRGMIIFVREFARRNRNASCNGAPLNSIWGPSLSEFVACWSGPSDLCDGRKGHPTDRASRLNLWRALQAGRKTLEGASRLDSLGLGGTRLVMSELGLRRAIDVVVGGRIAVVWHGPITVVRQRAAGGRRTAAD